MWVQTRPGAFRFQNHAGVKVWLVVTLRGYILYLGDDSKINLSPNLTVPEAKRMALGRLRGYLNELIRKTYNVSC